MNLNYYSDILTIQEVQEILKIGQNQCYSLLNSGKLKGFRLGTKTWKVPKESVELFIRHNGK